MYRNNVQPERRHSRGYVDEQQYRNSSCWLYFRYCNRHCSRYCNNYLLTRNGLQYHYGSNCSCRASAHNRAGHYLHKRKRDLKRCNRRGNVEQQQYQCGHNRPYQRHNDRCCYGNGRNYLHQGLYCDNHYNHQPYANSHNGRRQCMPGCWHFAQQRRFRWYMVEQQHCSGNGRTYFRHYFRVVSRHINHYLFTWFGLHYWQNCDSKSCCSDSRLSFYVRGNYHYPQQPGCRWHMEQQQHDYCHLRAHLRRCQRFIKWFVIYQLYNTCGLCYEHTVLRKFNSVYHQRHYHLMCRTDNNIKQQHQWRHLDE